MSQEISRQDKWNFEKIGERTKDLSERLMRIWPRPRMDEAEIREYALLGKDAPEVTYITVKDLIAAGALEAAEKLATPEGSIYSGISCYLDSNGNFVFGDGKVAESPTGAAKYAAKLHGGEFRNPNGWTFWDVPRLGCKLSDVRSQFYSSSSR